jgi:hypothetical protein
MEVTSTDSKRLETAPEVQIKCPAVDYAPATGDPLVSREQHNAGPDSGSSRITADLRDEEYPIPFEPCVSGHRA